MLSFHPCKELGKNVPGKVRAGVRASWSERGLLQVMRSRKAGLDHMGLLSQQTFFFLI